MGWNSPSLQRVEVNHLDDGSGGGDGIHSKGGAPGSYMKQAWSGQGLCTGAGKVQIIGGRHQG